MSQLLLTPTTYHSIRKIVPCGQIAVDAFSAKAYAMITFVLNRDSIHRGCGCKNCLGTITFPLAQKASITFPYDNREVSYYTNMIPKVQHTYQQILTSTFIIGASSDMTPTYSPLIFCRIRMTLRSDSV